MKCPTCGADMPPGVDIPAMNVQYSWKQLLFKVPVMLLGFWPLAQLTILWGDVTKDIVVRQVEKNFVFRILQEVCS